MKLNINFTVEIPNDFFEKTLTSIGYEKMKEHMDNYLKNELEKTFNKENQRVGTATINMEF
ncbi:hypothetical protein KQI68_07220 [Peptoniphilus sp. MSJ-1]|uniref:Uncharacterized protein n=1 Tax=Peptoniphilus ovalis TaxID=2841503 RepID=A0ABS6FHK0_9FIRM|nr:hypothetical protein [Peptoniphilus ovalis]MBU5669629.1 hypothetical protein [Peptoniphilus ovalis]